MILRKGNMWSVYGKTNLFCITTNSTLNKKGELVMGAGIALQAKNRMPELPFLAGRLVKEHGDEYGLLICSPSAEQVMGLFQTKKDWRQQSDLYLIMIGVHKLLHFLKQYPDIRVDMPFPGIGNGGLSPKVVLPTIENLPNNVNVWIRE